VRPLDPIFYVVEQSVTLPQKFWLRLHPSFQFGQVVFHAFDFNHRFKSAYVIGEQRRRRYDAARKGLMVMQAPSVS
jgi:hypothetical protein